MDSDVVAAWFCGDRGFLLRRREGWDGTEDRRVYPTQNPTRAHSIGRGSS